MAIPEREQLRQLIKELNNKIIQTELSGLYNVWLPKKAVMKFLDYGETQMREVEQEHNLVISKIKARKFYSVESILNMLEKHKKQQ